MFAFALLDILALCAKRTSTNALRILAKMALPV
jgi:hypothetical protein